MRTHTGWHVSLSPILSWNQYRTQADVSPCSLTWMAQSEFFALPLFLYLLPRWKNHTNRVLRLISVEFSATWQLHFHWNPPEHAVFSLAEYVFGVDDFRPMRVQCLLNVWQWCHLKVMNDYHVGTYYLFDLDRGLCDFSTGAASLPILFRPTLL